MITKSIANFRNGVGNFVLYTPALRAIASLDPSGMVDLCVDADWEDGRKGSVIDLAKKLPFIQDVFMKSDTFKKTYKTWFWSNWSTHGLAHEIFSAMKPQQAENWNQNAKHESDYYFEIAQNHYGYKGWKPTQLVVPDVDPILSKDKIKIVLCDGSFGDIALLKKWGGFKSLAVHIKQFFGDRVSLIKIGTGDELSDVKTDINFVSQLTMTQTAKVIQQADLMITTDTGNMHSADALGTPIIVLWGGSIQAKNKPINAMNKIISLGLDCQPCIQSMKYTDCKNECLDDLTDNEVMYYIRKFFAEGRF